MAEHDELAEVLPPQEYAVVDKAIFRDAHALTNSEMNLILTGVMTAKREKQPNWQPPSVMQKTMDYTGKFANVRNTEALKAIRECVCGGGSRILCT